MPVETIGTRFGGIPQSLPLPHVPALSLAKVIDVLPAALSFALLGCIESLLSAVVADSMSGPPPPLQLRAGGARHRQHRDGVLRRLLRDRQYRAHRHQCPLWRARPGIGNAAFGLPVGVHAAGGAACPYIPLAALAGVLAVVAWNMAEKNAFAALLRTSRGDAVVLT